MKNILIVVPTDLESKYFAERGLKAEICGVGMAECAARTAELIVAALPAGRRPDLVVLAGIAGSCSDDIATGETVVVSSETVADLGRWSGGPAVDSGGYGPACLPRPDCSDCPDDSDGSDGSDSYGCRDHSGHPDGSGRHRRSDRSLHPDDSGRYDCSGHPASSDYTGEGSDGGGDNDGNVVKEGGFTPLFQKTYRASVVPYGFRAVGGYTVSMAGAPVVRPATLAVENMEGAAFFAVCERLGVPAMEVRTVSNCVGERIAPGDMELAVRRLAVDLERILASLR